MNDVRPGDVLLVEVPFTDLSASKKRPAVALLSRGRDHLVAFFTSRLEQAGPGDPVVTPSSNNGLAVNSAVLVTKLFTLHESLIVRRLGRLAEPDHRAIIHQLTSLLAATIARDESGGGGQKTE